MGLYNVVEPCVVGKLHYARPTTQPIEVDDDVEAAELVEAGSLAPYQPGGPDVESVEQTDHEGTAVGDPEQDPLPTGDFAPADETPAEPPPRPRPRRRTED